MSRFSGGLFLMYTAIDCALPFTMMSMSSACSLADTAFIAPFFLVVDIAEQVFCAAHSNTCCSLGGVKPHVCAQLL